MKKLIIITHPNLETSNINKTWLGELQKYPDNFLIHELYQQYPDLNFDIAAEQALLEQYEEIIFQFPIHWYSTPFALKKYIDEVFAYGWAFGHEGDKLSGKKIGFAVSTGGPEVSYESDSGISVASLLNDFMLSFQYCGCELGHLHVFYGAMFEPSEESVLENAREYANAFLESDLVI